MLTKTTYFKRYRMELDLRGPRPAAPLPPGFRWVPWADSLLDTFAAVKFRCFDTEMDTDVFPSLGSPEGCRELMRAIRSRPGFCAAATWLVESPDGDRVATVQGILDENRYGGIQNLGVAPDFRGKGIGRAVLLKALDGFAAVGSRRAFLEVTAKNLSAVRLYRELGFRCYRTVYRRVDVTEPVPIGAGV